MSDPYRSSSLSEPVVDDSADSSGSSAAFALRWLNDNGAALEMRVASKFLVTPSTVEHSGYYRDVREDVLREFDVHAVFTKNAGSREANFEVHVIAECKASTAPWILYMASQPYGSFDWDFENFFEVSAEQGESVRDLSGFPFAPAFRTAGQVHAYQVAEAAKKNSAPYDAVRQALDAVAGIRAGHVAAADRGRSPRLRLYVPVVVTTSPMFEVRLSGSGDIELTETTVTPYFAKRRADHDGSVSTRLVWLVHESAVDRVVGKVLDSLNMMSI